MVKDNIFSAEELVLENCSDRGAINLSDNRVGTPPFEKISNLNHRLGTKRWHKDLGLQKHSVVAVKIESKDLQLSQTIVEEPSRAFPSITLEYP
ncbi:hypothetical protein GCM10023210_14190 [Chryseobacterium ginsengisoli]|uniref:Uncharacterized protein n=1 Tax=Chryseobacterium ginsengisoli TaxID=363853 RepID=A0ABP9M6T0_9FLAO